MINHARTLLLNVAGPASRDRAHIPLNFAPVLVPNQFLPFSQAVLPPTDVKELREQGVDLWTPLLQSPDTERFALALDNRLTYRVAVKKRVATGDSFNITSAIDRVVAIGERQSGVGRNGLFRPFTGFEEELADLKALWDSKTRSEDRAVAVVYGFIYQLERVRRNG